MPLQISPQRKTAFYIGTVVMVVGVLLFAWALATAVTNQGGSTDMRSFGVRLFGGMGVMIVGLIVRGLGARGLAGSGLVLDPEQARQDLKPHSRMVGGVVKDVLEGADIQHGAKTQRVVMVKCRACGRLNEEDSKFCQECAQAL